MTEKKQQQLGIITKTLKFHVTWRRKYSHAIETGVVYSTDYLSLFRQKECKVHPNCRERHRDREREKYKLQQLSILSTFFHIVFYKISSSIKFVLWCWNIGKLVFRNSKPTCLYRIIPRPRCEHFILELPPFEKTTDDNCWEQRPKRLQCLTTAPPRWTSWGSIQADQ